MTNNLVLHSSRCEFFFNFTLSLDSKAATGNSKEKEVLVLGVSPAVYDIKTYTEGSASVTLTGVNFFVFRDENNKGVVLMKQYQVPTIVNLKSVFDEDHRENQKDYCEYEMVNKAVAVNATIDFDHGSIYLSLDDVPCITGRAGEDVFPEEKATVYLTGLSTEQSPAKLVLHEARLSKYVDLLPSETHFAGDLKSVISHLTKHDPNYYKNSSLSNTMLMGVGLLAKDQEEPPEDEGTHGAGRGAHQVAPGADRQPPGQVREPVLFRAEVQRAAQRHRQRHENAY